jgi:hypothetical protein
MKNTSSLYAIIVINMFCICGMNAQSYDSLVTQANSLYRAKEYSKSVEYYEQAFSENIKKPNDFYSAACSAALAGEKEKALAFLDRAIENGWKSPQYTQSDMDLLSLHEEREWSLFLEKMQKNINDIEARINKPLRSELLRIGDDDQKYRLMADSVIKNYGYQSQQKRNLFTNMHEIDSINTVKVKAIIAMYGWVGADKVGEKANGVIFAVIQHADSLTQHQYLPLMREAVKKCNARASSLALLEDRVALQEGKKQIYRSQMRRAPESGEWFVEPLADPDNVDERRAEVGLGKLADYLKQWNIQWDVYEYKKKNPN